MINWFPGHMNKARRELAERVKKSDVVIELLDARMPRASENPMLERIRGSLPCIKLLTKTDLADRSVTARWKAHLKGEGVDVEDVVATEPKLGAKLVRASQRAVPERGRPGFPVRAMIVGIPNVGKSTLFNTLLGKSKAEVRNKPAITRREQQAVVGNSLVIVDTPGVLWPKLEDQRAAHCLAAAGSISEAAFDPVEVCCFLIEVLRTRYPAAFATRYKLEANASEAPVEAKALLEQIGRRRGCLVRGGSVDLNKAASILLTDVRSSKLGPLSLETPDDYAANERDVASERPPGH